jgi:endonuclease/exonuclease/phosphatase (EEP) superfamily protein YafD
MPSVASLFVFFPLLSLISLLFLALPSRPLSPKKFVSSLDRFFCGCLALPCLRVLQARTMGKKKAPAVAEDSSSSEESSHDDSESSGSSSPEGEVEEMNVTEGSSSSEESGDGSSGGAKKAHKGDPTWRLKILPILEVFAGFFSISTFVFYGYTSYHMALQSTGFRWEAVLCLLWLLVPSLLLLIPAVRRFVSARDKRMIIRIPSIIMMPLQAAIGVYYVRLFVMLVAMTSLIFGMYVASRPATGNGDQLAHHERYWRGFVLGHFVLISLRLAALSINPINLHIGVAAVGAGIAIGVCILLVLCDRSTEGEVSTEIQPSQVDLLGCPPESTVEITEVEMWAGAITKGLWLGTSLFLLAWATTQPFLFARWTGDDLPFLWAGFVTVMFAIGAVVSIHHAFPPFACVLFVLGLFLFSFERGPGGGIAAGAFMGVSFAEVWFCLATALGNIRREFVLAVSFCMAGLVMAVFYLLSIANLTGDYTGIGGMQSRVDILGFVCLFFIIVGIIPLLLEVFRFADSARKWFLQYMMYRAVPADRFQKIMTVAVTFVFCVVTLIVGLVLSIYDVKAPEHDNADLVVISWNVFQGHKSSVPEVRLNMDEILAELDEQEADIVGLQESDSMHYVTGNRDIVTYLSSSWKSHAFYGLPVRDATVGCAMLSKHKLKDTKARVMPAEETFTLNRPYTSAKITVKDKDVTLINTHLEFVENDDPLRQVDFLIEEVAEISGPIIMMGDFNHEVASAFSVFPPRESFS